MGSAPDLLRSKSLRIDETVPAASSALRSKESPSPPVWEPFLFNSSTREEGGLILCAGGFQTVMGMTASGCSTALPKEPFAFAEEPRLRTQSFRDLNRRRQHSPRYLSVGRRGRGRRLQFRNLAPSRTIFLNGV